MSQEVATVCKGCAGRVKHWQGSDPQCGFLHGPFVGGDNWQCVTAGKIRDLCVKEGDERIQHVCSEDQHYATISTLNFRVLSDYDVKGMLTAQPVCLWVGWYKNRGRTEAMWLMFEDLPPRAPTEEECLKILSHFSK